MAARRKEEKPRTKKRDGAAAIKTIALELFTKKGYKNTTVRDICNVMEITAPSLYYYFSSKEAIYSAILQEATTSLTETLQTAMSSCKDKTMKGKLFQLFEAIMDLYQEQPDQMIFLLRDRYFPEREISHEEVVPMTSWLSLLEEEVVTFLENSGKLQQFNAPMDQVLAAFDRLITGLVLQQSQGSGDADVTQAWEMFVKGI